jgi:hypothetical protein
MKRNSLGLLFLLVACSLACSPASNNNNGGGNNNSPTNNGNAAPPANANNSNVKSSLRPLDVNTKMVTIIVFDEKGGRKVQAVPEIVSLNLDANERVRFNATDALGTEIESIEMDFGKVSPLEGGPKFTIGTIDPGGLNSTDTGKALMQGTYKYSIKVRVKGLGDPLILDPQVEISGGGVR